MDVEDYFIIALVFAIAAFLSLLMRGNPFNMWLNSDSFPLGFIISWVNGVQQSNGISIYNTAFSLLIFLPSAYFAIAFAIGGIVKTLVRRIGKKGKT